MKEVFLLTKILFKSSTTQLKEKNKSSFGKILLYLLAYSYIAGFIAYLSYQCITSLMLIKQEAVFLNICFIGVIGISLIQSIITSLNVLFFSKDMELLIPLPIKPIKIVLAKMNVLILSQYLLTFIILIPVLLVYGCCVKLGITFYLMGFALMLLLPIAPVVLVSLIITIIMKFFNIIKNKDMLQYLTVGLTLLLIIGIQFFTGNSITNEELANNLVKANGMVEVYSDFFITLKQAMNAILNYNNFAGVLNIILLLLESVVIYFLCSFIISKFYLKTALSVSAGGIKNSKKTNKNNFYKSKSVLKSYVFKEFKILNRNPIFFMQCVLPSILFPIIMTIPFFMSLKNNNIENVGEMKTIIADLINTPIGLCILLCIVVFLFIFNFASVTAVSRDGENALFMKYIPINLNKQIFYKAMPGILLNIVPIAYLVILMKLLLNTVHFKIYIYILLISFIVNVLNNLLLVIVDLKNPKLKWITEYAVVKQNFNMLYEMIICIIEIGILIVLTKFIQNIDFLAISTIALFGLLTLFTKIYINKNELKLFKKVN